MSEASGNAEAGFLRKTAVTERSGKRPAALLATQSLVLVQAAHAILQHAPASNRLATWGRALTYRKCKNIAAITVARKLTVYIWYLLRGFFTPLNNLSTSFRTKLQKLAVEIGTPLRREMGYKTIKGFIQKKEKLLLAGT